jgi:hypothetical protein
MKEIKWQLILGIGLVALSALLYTFHYVFFHDVHHIFIYLVGDVAFVPIEVLLVTLIIHKLLSQREKKARLEKLNMVIGTFFSEVGTRLLTYFSDFDPKLEEIRSKLIVSSDWTAAEFDRVESELRAYAYSVDISRVDLEHLREFLRTRRDFLVRLLENPTLLEHESFTLLLRAVFHLTEELESRGSMAKLPESDYTHLAGDMKRVYILIVREWLDYMEHLKHSYPYLFSLAMRTNPFDQDATPVVAQ